jgi:hypothetical protein
MDYSDLIIQVFLVNVQLAQVVFQSHIYTNIYNKSLQGNPYPKDNVNENKSLHVAYRWHFVFDWKCDILCKSPKNVYLLYHN